MEFTAKMDAFVNNWVCIKVYVYLPVNRFLTKIYLNTKIVMHALYCTYYLLNVIKTKLLTFWTNKSYARQKTKAENSEIIFCCHIGSRSKVQYIFLQMLFVLKDMCRQLVYMTRIL